MLRPAMVLTRDLIAQGGIARMIAETSPSLRMLSDEERAASLRATLAARPPGRGGVWLFAYGSLIWNPALRVAEQRRARVQGWHRAFCLSTIAGRGTPEAPGLVLGLDRGGACTGAALRVEEAHVDTELDLLWRREMLSGSYQPRWVELRGADGRPFGRGIAFTIRREGEYYCRLTREETARRLATAAGALGSSAEYLFRTRDGLRSLGIRDRAIEALARAVEAAAISSPAGTP
jgi:glutathione-specific gamma-glutamylcyclotransferase